MNTGNKTASRDPFWITSNAICLLVTLMGLNTPMFGATVEYQIVVLPAPSDNDTTTTVPVSGMGFAVGDNFYLEAWVQTSDANGLSSASLDILFDPSLVTGVNITPSSVFSELTHGNIDNVNGLIDDLSGSHLGSCLDAVAVMPDWTRLAVVEFYVETDGILQIKGAATNSEVYRTAVCGVGDIDPANINHKTTTVAVGDAVIPTVSTWGMIALCLLILIAGTHVMQHRICVYTL